MFDNLKYIYIHQNKVPIINIIVSNNPFDQGMIEKSKTLILNLYGFDFDDRSIPVKPCKKMLEIQFEYDYEIHSLYLGYLTSKDFLSKIRKKKSIFLNLYAIEGFDIKELEIVKYSDAVFYLDIPSIQACFSFWNGYVNFEGACFQGNLDFYGSYFLSDISFFKAEFFHRVYFRYVKFIGFAEFNYSIFTNSAIFEGITFYKLDMSHIVIKDSSMLKNINALLNEEELRNTGILIHDIETNDFEVDWDKNLKVALLNSNEILNITKKEKDFYSILSSEFLFLNKIYKIRAQYDSEDETYFLFRKYRMKAIPIHFKKGSMSTNYKKMKEWIFYIIGGYGTKISWIILSMILVILVFTSLYIIIYYVFRGYIDCVVAYNCMMLSIQAFFSFIYINLDVFMIKTILPLLCIESVVGSIMMIYFTICFSRKAIR